jgi:hypothetical protein
MEHVDEMMLQFRGREDELLETLRTMQERQVAHKARATNNKQVKLETKQAVREKRQFAEIALSQQEEKKPVTPPTIFNAADEEGERSANSSPASFDVALALNYNGKSPSSALNGADSKNDASPLKMPNKSWNELSKESKQPDTNDESNDQKALRQHQLKEERTALAQSEMWMGIAMQNKTKETEESGGAASQAADWAIARSLFKMKEKEQQDRASDALSDQDQADKDGQESV